MITISACLIVKNEEKVLARCLDSLREVYDELIIVDTGSTDRTKEIAKEYTNKIYEFPWINDFAAARNFSFSKATQEYIYVADADEVLEEQERKKFLQLKQVLLPEIEIVQMQYANQLEFNTTYNYDCELRPKLYKRVRNFVWTDPVHESVVLDPVVYDSEITISHRPTSNHGTRDFAVFQSILKRGQKLSKKLVGMYSRELYIAGEDKDFLEAEEFYRSLLEETQDLKPVYSILLRCARIQGNTMEVIKLSTKALAGNLECSELCYELGEFYYGNAEYEEAVLWFYNAAFETESELNLKYHDTYSLSRLADCKEALGCSEDAIYYRDLAVRGNE